MSWGCLLWGVPCQYGQLKLLMGTCRKLSLRQTGWKIRRLITPANVSLVSSEDLTNWNSRSVADALENVPGVRVVRNGLGTNGANVYLNGEERVLFLVDGLPRQ